MFDNGKRKPLPTQLFVNPKTGERARVNHDDGENIRRLRECGFNRKGGIKDAGCHTYEIR